MATSRLANKVRTKIKQNKAKEALDIETAASNAAAALKADEKLKEQAEIVAQVAEEGSVEQYTSIQAATTSDTGSKI